MMYPMISWNDNSSSPSTGKQKFTGLSNQGATCYMNSLLQSLYMTPEFRRKMYMWMYDEDKHGDKKDSIPFNLQLLFGKLQISKAPYVETKALTTSFGWNIREGFQQHDVQEFCRVLFDAIEESVRGTPDENMINSMYEGSMTDYVKCLNCGHESQRTDTFLDLSLTVRNEFDKIYNDSVEKALSNFIKPEKLCDNNKYFCELCDSKQDALKGFKFEKFPHLLVLQLKRFDLDYTTFQRIKLNDKVTFPEVLNMNEYLKDYSEAEDTPPVSEVTNTDNKEPLVFKHLPSDLDSREMVHLNNNNYEHICDDRDKHPLHLDSIAKEKLIEKQTLERKMKEQQKIEEYLTQGEFVYELFSIMIHSGSAIGGHYYAYIKDFEDSRWYNFNDSVVTPLDPGDIQKVYGGIVKTTGWSSNYAANAYLLMYRKVKTENILSISEAEVPGYIKDELEALLEQDRINAAEKAEKHKQLTLKVYYLKNDKTFTIKKDQPLSKLKELAIEEFKLHDLQPEDLRIRAYSQYYDIFQDIYKEDANLDEQSIWNYKHLGIEVKEPGTEWPPYNPNGITVKVNLWDDSLSEDPRSLEEKTGSPRKIIVDKKEPVKSMLQTFEEEFGIPMDKMIVLKKIYMGVNTQCEIVNTAYNMDLSLTYARIYEGSIFYIEEKQEGSGPSRWQLLFEKESRRYTIKFNHPDETSQHASYTEYKHSVIVDCFSTLDVLKEEIARKIGVPSDEFIMKRGGKHCQEMKDMGLRLTQANLVNTSVIYIERGKPTKLNEYRILFSLASLAKPEDGDAACFSFVDLFDLPVDSGILISELKKVLAAKIVEMYPSMEVEPSRMRLRERNTERLSRVVRDNDFFRQYALYEKKNMSVQLLPEDVRELENDEMIVVVKRWWPSTWEISEGREIVINKFGTLNDLGKVLSDEFGIPHENLEVAKITYSWTFARADLRTEIFYKTMGNNNSVGQNPWYLNLDGSLLFVRDKEEEIREMTDSEKRKFSRNAYVSYGSSPYKYKPPPEEAVKIRVVKKQKEETPKKDTSEKDANEGTETSFKDSGDGPDTHYEEGVFYGPFGPDGPDAPGGPSLHSDLDGIEDR